MDEYDCQTCDESFEPGDRVLAVWTGPVDDDLDYEGQSLDLYHANCVRIQDDRPPVYRLAKPSDRHGAVVHAFPPVRTGTFGTGDTHRSFCGAVTAPEDSLVTGRSWDFGAAVEAEFGDERFCSHCRSSTPPANRY